MPKRAHRANQSRPHANAQSSSSGAQRISIELGSAERARFSALVDVTGRSAADVARDLVIAAMDELEDNVRADAAARKMLASIRASHPVAEVEPGPDPRSVGRPLPD
ncbi:hypothetical protein GCM10017602_35420 [Herbiconiux flava]|nr:hypothetical protein GCM10017602_35420 [Herbiconiux flava]